MEKLFSKHLFPDISEETSFNVTPRIPVLDSSSRSRLYAVLLALTTDLTSYRKLLDLTESLVSLGEQNFAWSHGYAQLSEDYSYELSWNFDRYKAIRAYAGYVGMRNLANTCYLNSLFTQLFMNANFRKFMLETNITDEEGSQKLLSETKKLFSCLQESWSKAADPENLASAIITYDGAPIDVSIQMDVDEFYNLLFDRWESQIPSSADKTAFRNFYGGHLVQQIKSKDCPHISERLEPFSAIQCEIQGKKSLLESLDAYVEGEVMEGGTHLIQLWPSLIANIFRQQIFL